VSELDRETRDALAELLLAMADDEFVLGFWDSEWTGIAPILEEDVAMSSVSQDEIGHAKALYELLAELTGEDADKIAFGRPADAYRHAALMNHARTDWAFSIARRFLYENADAVRLESLAASGYQPLADLAVKMRREETYHLLHFDLWLRRLAEGMTPGRGSPRPLRASGRMRRPSSHHSPVRPPWSPRGSCRNRSKRCGHAGWSG
jgi:ring-1,2-phenylacetyl-CoA epoxidase subunit PaaC